MDKVKEMTTARLTGSVKITCVNEKTGEVKIVENHNLVVNNTYEQLAKLLGLVDGFVTPITNIAFGIGGATAPAVTDTSITGVVTSIAATVTYPVAYTVVYTASWGSAASSAADINEVGLLFQDNSLAARQVFSIMRKSTGWTWTIVWTLAYSV